MTVGLVGAKYHIGQKVLTLKGPGTIYAMDIVDKSIYYYVELDINRGHYIFEQKQVFDLIKEELGI